MIFRGSGVALVTPFVNNKVNYEKLEELIEFQITSGTDALIILGTTGENVCLSMEEKKKIISFTIARVKKRIPVIVGTGSPNTEAVIELSKYAEYKDADGLLIVTPYYNKPSQKGLYEHYKKIADSTNLSIILYNVPSRTSVNLSTDTIIELSKIENIVGIKEANGDLLSINRIINNTKPNFYVYSGNDDQVLDILKLGGKGVISVTANLIPAVIQRIVYNHLKGDKTKAVEEFNNIRNINQILFIETNPVPIKTAMNLVGMNVGPTRLPLVEMSEKNLEILKLCLRDLSKTYPNLEVKL